MSEDHALGQQARASSEEVVLEREKRRGRTPPGKPVIIEPVLTEVPKNAGWELNGRSRCLPNHGGTPPQVDLLDGACSARKPCLPKRWR